MSQVLLEFYQNAFYHLSNQLQEVLFELGVVKIVLEFLGAEKISLAFKLRELLDSDVSWPRQVLNCFRIKKSYMKEALKVLPPSRKRKAEKEDSEETKDNRSVARKLLLRMYQLNRNNCIPVRPIMHENNQFVFELKRVINLSEHEEAKDGGVEKPAIYYMTTFTYKSNEVMLLVKLSWTRLALQYVLPQSDIFPDLEIDWSPMYRLAEELGPYYSCLLKYMF